MAKKHSKVPAAGAEKPIRDLYQEVTRKVILALEKGVAPWIRPWSTGEGFPINATTNVPYQGINVLVLWSTAMNAEYPTDRWLTFKQACEVGGHVRAKESGTTCLKYQMIEKTVTNPDGTTGLERFPLPKPFTLFNVAQCDNLPAEVQLGALQGPPLTVVQRIEVVESYLSRIPAKVIHRGDVAKYDLVRDVISLPNPARFSSPEAYYSRRAHELIKWTMTEDRCARTYSESDPTAQAFEMLVAEMGAAFLCAQWGLLAELQHPQYIAAWLEALGNDKTWLFKALRQARKAVEYLTTYQSEAMPTLPKAA